MTDDLEAGIDRLVDASPSGQGLVAHGLHLFAARRWRSLGRPVPADLVRAELRHQYVDHVTPTALARIRGASEADILVLKGPAAAALYGDPLLRPYHDLDVLVTDPERLQAALVADGFVEAGEKPPTGHHLRPLSYPGLPLAVEVHAHPKWLRGVAPPSVERLARGAEPVAGVDGALTLAPAEHAALLAVHVWAHDPLTRLLRLIDVAMACRHVDRAAVDAVVGEWGLERLWRATADVVESVLLRSRAHPAPVRLWGRGLVAVREPTIWESYLGRVLGPFFVLDAAAAARSSAAEVSWLVRPADGESVPRRAARIARHAVRAGSPRTEVRRDDEERDTHG